MMESILTPVLALVTWSLVMWFWLYLTRIPAMQKAGINAAKMKEKSEMDVLPRKVRQVAENYNHLHEQPVVFYALAFYTHLAGPVTGLTVGLAWAYVLFRVLHSLYQATVNFIPVRFMLFVLSSLMLVALTVVNLWALPV
ncbi:MAG: MAPEG family protein [Parvularculaceae bacterium]|nr:MAPEG family protein [Parvularculaceae bacterium]